MKLYDCRCDECSVGFNMALESESEIEKMICPECGGNDLRVVRSFIPDPPRPSFGGG